MKKNILKVVLVIFIIFTATTIFNGCDDPTKVKNLKVSPEVMHLTVGKVQYFIALIDPVTASDKRVIWESLDSEVASIDDKGKVTAISAGSTMVTCITYDKKHVKYLTVTVK
ncbi:MAG: Ig-like domain-containing protein [Bacteroidales bacterium]|jgi:uncharacterized protein YjdB|nr:Ig-like domain-containing protein [Bacteroidales bacterium]